MLAKIEFSLRKNQKKNFLFYRFFYKLDHGADFQEARLAVLERLEAALSIQRHRSDQVPLVSLPPPLPPLPPLARRSRRKLLEIRSL